MRNPVPIRVLAIATLFGGSAFAAPPTARALSVYERGSAADQLETDITPIPVGMGALFVPAATRPDIEPPVLVLFGQDRVAWGRTGERIVVPPGEYTVVVGHGEMDHRARTNVRVVNGVTTPTPPFFAALRVSATDTDGRPLNVDYALESNRAGTVGTAATSEKRSYTSTKTWLVPPGPVTLALLNGDKYSRNAIEVDLSAGELARYRLVVDADRLVRAELAERELIPRAQRWRARWSVGGDASFSRTAGQLGAFNGDYLRGGIFSHAQVGYDHGQHLALLNIDVEESWIGLGNEPGQDLSTQKFSDEVSAELLYNLRVAGVIGPYARARGRTSLFDTAFRPAVDTTVVRVDDNGRELRRGTVRGGKELKLFDGFSPMDLRAAIGVGVTAVDVPVFELRFYGGAAGRRATYGDGIFIQDYQEGRVEAVVIQDDESVGAEFGAVASLRLSQTFGVEVRGDVYTPRDQIFDDSKFDPVFRLDSRATFSVNRFLAVAYQNYIRKDAYELDEARVSHMLSVRLTHTLF